jgi:hypothetical protein
MTLGGAMHQMSEESERDMAGKGEACADASLDEAFLACQEKEGLGRGDLLMQALSRVRTWRRRGNASKPIRVVQEWMG